MNVTHNRHELLMLAQRAAAIAPKASPLDALKGVLLETDQGTGQLTLTATNLEIFLQQNLRCTPLDDDALVVDAQFFAAMLAQLDGETVTLSRTDSMPELTISSGTARYTVPILERGSFPSVEIPFPEDTVKVHGIPAMARQTVFAASVNSDQPLLKCVNLMFTQDGLRAVCSNGDCMVSARGDNGSTGNVSLLMPAQSLEKLARLSTDDDEFRVGTTGKSIVFLKENMTYSARLMEGSYINADGLMNAAVNQFTVLTSVYELKDALRTVMSVNPDEKVIFHFAGNMLTVSCDGVYGKAKTQIEVIPMTGAPQGEYCYLSNRLAACFRALKGNLTLGIAQGGMLTLASENAFYMQPGMRIPKEDPKPPKSKKAA